MMDLILIGGGGHCRSCIDVIESEGRYNIIGILDQKDQIGEIVSGYKVIGNDDDIFIYAQKDYFFLITIGQLENPELRIKIFNLIKKYNGKLATVISPRAYISRTASVGDGSIIMHDALVNAHAVIGYNCIINTKALIEHDCNISSHSHISTSSVVNGGVTIGKGSFFGSNAVSKQGVKIKSNSFIKAGSCYVKEKKNKKVSFLTTIYPINIDYVIEFFDSLSKQTENKFDIIVLNDGFINFNEIKYTYSNLHIIELEAVGSIAKNREKLIRFAKINQYDIAIFGDVDDTFSCERVEKTIELLNHNDIIVNELIAVHKEQVISDSIYSKRLKNKQVIDFNFIKDKNIFGLSNTAINLSIVSLNDINFNDKLIAVDWYFFSLLLLKGNRAKFISNIITFYRQHDNNTVGISRFTKEKIKFILKVKSIHYELMLGKHSDYNKLLEDVNLYLNEMLNEKELELALFNNLNNIEFPLWWELI